MRAKENKHTQCNIAGQQSIQRAHLEGIVRDEKTVQCRILMMQSSDDNREDETVDSKNYKMPKMQRNWNS